MKLLDRPAVYFCSKCEKSWEGGTAAALDAADWTNIAGEDLDPVAGDQ